MSNERDIPEEWFPYRDQNGHVVTITEEQLWAIWHAIRVVDDVRLNEGHRRFFDEDSPGGVELYKSRLLGRILLQGLPPTKSSPPIEMGGPAWWLLPGGDPWEEWTG